MRSNLCLLAVVLLPVVARAATPEMTDMEDELSDQRMRVETSIAVAPRKSQARSLSGPRIGVTYLMGEEAELIKEKLGINPVISQFGWQFERRFFEQPGGFSGVNEFILLLGGLDQATILPSASWIIGVRTAGGAEFGAGPVLGLVQMLSAIGEGEFGLGQGRSLAGIGFAAAAGTTITSGDVNFPINLALVRSDGGLRLSLLVGFNLQTEDELPAPRAPSASASRIRRTENATGLPPRRPAGAPASTSTELPAEDATPEEVAPRVANDAE